MNRIIDDMIEKIELFDRKLYILEDLINDLRLNYNIIKDIVNVKTIKTIKPIRKRREPFNNYVLDSSDSDNSSESD
jgi:hypothetical protein